MWPNETQTFSVILCVSPFSQLETCLMINMVERSASGFLFTWQLSNQLKLPISCLHKFNVKTITRSLNTIHSKYTFSAEVWTKVLKTVVTYIDCPMSSKVVKHT